MAVTRNTKMNASHPNPLQGLWLGSSAVSIETKQKIKTAQTPSLLWDTHQF